MHEDIFTKHTMATHTVDTWMHTWEPGNPYNIGNFQGSVPLEESQWHMDNCGNVSNDEPMCILIEHYSLWELVANHIWLACEILRSWEETYLNGVRKEGDDMFLEGHLED